MLTFDDKGGGGVKKTQKPAYVIHGCSPSRDDVRLEILKMIALVLRRNDVFIKPFRFLLTFTDNYAFPGWKNRKIFKKTN